MIIFRLTYDKLVNKFFNPKILADYILKTGDSEFISPLRTAARLKWKEIADAEKNYKDLYKILKPIKQL